MRECSGLSRGYDLAALFFGDTLLLCVLQGSASTCWPVYGRQPRLWTIVESCLDVIFRNRVGAKRSREKKVSRILGPFLTTGNPHHPRLARVLKARTIPRWHASGMSSRSLLISSLVWTGPRQTIETVSKLATLGRVSASPRDLKSGMSPSKSVDKKSIVSLSIGDAISSMKSMKGGDPWWKSCMVRDLRCAQ